MDTSADHFGCCGLNHEGSSDASKASGAVWLVLGIFNSAREHLHVLHYEDD